MKTTNDNPSSSTRCNAAPFDPFGLEALTVLWGGDLAARLDMAERTHRALASSHADGLLSSGRKGLGELDLESEVVNEDVASLPGDAPQAAVAA
jgi:hypothetical protein